MFNLNEMGFITFLIELSAADFDDILEFPD